MSYSYYIHLELRALLSGSLKSLFSSVKSNLSLSLLGVQRLGLVELSNGFLLLSHLSLLNTVRSCDSSGQGVLTEELDSGKVVSVELELGGSRCVGQAKLLNGEKVFLGVLSFEVGKHLSSILNQLVENNGVLNVLLVFSQVVRQVVNSNSVDGGLDLGGSSVARESLKLLSGESGLVLENGGRVSVSKGENSVDSLSLVGELGGHVSLGAAESTRHGSDLRSEEKSLGVGELESRELVGAQASHGADSLHESVVRDT